MTTPWYKRLSEGMSRSREQLSGQLNVLLRRGPNLDEQFWEELEDTLIGSDMGVSAVTDIVGRLRDAATRKALADASEVIDHLTDEIASELTLDTDDFLAAGPVTVLVIGVNGTGKTTTVGKLAKQSVDEGRSVLLGSADTYRAAAIEQLDVWAERAGVPIVRRERGSDPASVAFETVERASVATPDITLIDTAGRLHTSPDLMLELQKVKRVTEKRSDVPVKVLLVMDATTGQNGLNQAREFDAAMNVNGLVITKLDGTAKGGIAVAVARELGIPILRIGVGEGIDDLRPFDAKEFASAITRGV
ncbi:MAG: signal recognition particle-docking protein FtsY [Actinomycetota bacterium]|jgi:fused signal recognition particle receptor|nr:signal recognition particle-docking protein FtsY [Actinomycetota bacterium]